MFLKIYLIVSFVIFLYTYLLVKDISKRVEKVFETEREFFPKSTGKLWIIQIFIMSFIPIFNLLLLYAGLFKNKIVYEKVKMEALVEIIKNKKQDKHG